MIYDCFTFFNELDLLEIRLNILSPVVDKFVIVEANTTFQGNPKPFYFEENEDRFDQWRDYITYVKVEDMPTNDSWAAEYHQRNCILRGLVSCDPYDTIMISDLDEIPNPFVVANFGGVDEQVMFLQQLYYYYLNVEATGANNWPGTRVTPMRLLGMPQNFRATNPIIQIGDAGWHWSFLGGPDAIADKVRAFAHSEYNSDTYLGEDRIKEKAGNLQDIFDRNMSYQRMEIDDSFPQHIRDNQDKYRHLILPAVS